MKKLTDNEIINDFEKEIKYVRENEKYDDFNPIVDIDLCEDILDLIHRKDAEIERLEKALEEQYESSIIAMDVYKSEAVKEFAERLKHFIIPQKADGYTREIVLKRDIDNLVKEMTEGNENDRF